MYARIAASSSRAINALTGECAGRKRAVEMKNVSKIKIVNGVKDNISVLSNGHYCLVCKEFVTMIRFLMERLMIIADPN